MAYDVTQLVSHHQYFVISHLCTCAHRGTAVCEHKKCTSAGFCKQPHDYVISQSDWSFQKLLKLWHLNIIIVMKSSVKMPDFYRCFCDWEEFFSLKGYLLWCGALFSHLLTISHFPTRGHYGQEQRHVPFILTSNTALFRSQILVWKKKCLREISIWLILKRLLGPEVLPAKLVCPLIFKVQWISLWLSSEQELRHCWLL